MGLRLSSYFEDSLYEIPGVRIIACRGCSSHICLSEFVISDNFSGTSGDAFLVDKLINVEVSSPLVEKSMLTGIYLIHNIRCHQCKTELGWVYKKALDSRQNYKEGKYVIESHYLKFITNHASTNNLVEQALKNKIRRRYSSTSTVSTESNDDRIDTDNFKFVTPVDSPGKAKISEFRDLANGVYLPRVRLPSIDKSLEEEDEKEDVFVDT